MPKRVLHRIEILLAAGLIVALAMITGAVISVIHVHPFNIDISDNISAVTDRFFAIAKLTGGFALVVLTIPLAVLTLYRMVELVLRPPELLINEVNNATGISFLDSVAVGLSAQMREQVIKEGLDARRVFRVRGAAILPHGYTTPDDWPLPKRAAHYAAATLEAGLKGSLSGQVAPLAHLISVLLPPNGHSVSCTLQLGRAPQNELGITVEISHLRGKERPHIHTFWLSKQDGIGGPQHSLAFSDSPSLKKRAELAGIYSSLVVPAATWVAIEFFRTHVETWVNRHRFLGNRNNNRARMRHYIGEQFEAAALDMEQGKPSPKREFLRLAAHNFERAHELEPAWYLPLEGLADCYDWMFRSHRFVKRTIAPSERQEAAGEDEREKQEVTDEDEHERQEAADELEKALTTLEAAHDLAVTFRAPWEISARLVGEWALTQLIGELAAFRPELKGTSKLGVLMSQLLVEWDLNQFFEKRNAQEILRKRKEISFVFYNLACWHSLRSLKSSNHAQQVELSQNTGTADTLPARLCFAYSLILDWRGASLSSRSADDLKALRAPLEPISGLVKSCLDRYRKLQDFDEYPNLARLKSGEFKELVSSVQNLLMNGEAHEYEQERHKGWTFHHQS